MTSWYVMSTAAGNEEQAVELMQRVLSHSLWEQCLTIPMWH